METFEIKLLESEKFPVIAVKGYFNAETGKEVHQVADNLLRQDKIQIIIDFAACKVVNSLGIASLIDLALKILDDFKGRLVLAGLDDFKVSVFETAGLFPLAEGAKTVAEASQTLKS